MMKLSYLKTHWTPDEAHSILSFLDDLRDTLWQIYGKEIMEYHHQNAQTTDDKCEIDDDQIPF